MKKINSLFDNAKKLNAYTIMRSLFLDNQVTDKIIELNTQKQLYDKGINSKGQTLESVGGGYSAYTIMQKEAKGQPTDRVTLKDTGEFYDSFRCTWSASDTSIVITANSIKDDGKDLREEWGDEIIGLTDESKNVLVEMIKPKLQRIIRDILAI